MAMVIAKRGCETALHRAYVLRSGLDCTQHHLLLDDEDGDEGQLLHEDAEAYVHRAVDSV